ncbi:MAG: primosomal protein N' [Terriglobia bacterium]
MPAGFVCEVAVPLPLPTTFTYRIPEALREQVSVGVRVRVGFRERTLVGVVTAVTSAEAGEVRAAGRGTPAAAGKLREILEVIEREPLLTPTLLALAQWMRDYYFAPPGEVLRAMLPLGERRRPARVDRTLQLAPSYTELTLTRREQRVAEELARHGGGMRASELGRKAGVPASILRGLEAKGVVVPGEAAAELPLFESDWVIPLCGTEPVLTAEQERAVAELERRLDAGAFATVLVQGVTGSGKTELYSRAIQRCVAQGRTALLLVPEIALTPAVGQLFQARFGDEVAVLHSGLGARERSTAWWRLRRGEARIAVGTRSAVFAPLANLGLVIVDEEQDTSYKQEETPRYHGRDVAVVRAKLEGAVAVLGSATPALESSYQARTGGYHWVRLERRVADRPLATVEVVDMRQEFEETKTPALFSRRLRARIESTLASGGQVLVLLNRRGYAAFLLCRKCGATVQCANCSISLAYHRARNRLLCHYCGSMRALPARCLKCQSEHLYFVGEGTEKVEQELARLFPGARVGRLDRDTARRQRAHERILGQFARGELDILTGTQMIAKGHDFHRVTLVGVVSADGILGLPDFRAAERTFQLLTQVAGRAGRGELPGKVIVQSYYPDHYAIQFGARQDYEGFYEQELRFRRLMHYPPFTALANLVVRDPRLEVAIRYARLFERVFAAEKTGDVRVLGPAPAPLARLKRDYRFQFLLKAAERRALGRTLRAALEAAREGKVPPGAVVVDVDPISLL